MTATNHFPVMPERADTNRSAPQDSEAQGKTNMPNDTTLDALTGWFDLAKPARSRQKKKSWIVGGRR